MRAEQARRVTVFVRMGAGGFGDVLSRPAAKAFTPRGDFRHRISLGDDAVTAEWRARRDRIRGDAPSSRFGTARDAGSRQLLWHRQRFRHVIY
ncbi:hypothetical protein [Burkholderia pseudomallei]|uniref:hypothetical protein n=1 Tax=Burkholderia pseudomallei TaxID=28450 RepID=UPI00193D7F73|nr:hypothetical protein [Burkholderia pseudomallei]QRM25815.1 hypothetical protein JQX71_32320 [Burkholderia pseudomallei]